VVKHTQFWRPEAGRNTGGFMDAKDYVERGMKHVENGDVGSAIENFSEAIRLSPTPIKHFPYYLRGKAYYSKKEFDLAIADFDEAIRICGDEADYYLWRGVAYGYKKDDDRAIADFDEAVRINPKDAESYYNRGAVYSRKGDSDHAIADYSDAIRLDPNMAKAYGNRGREYIAKDDYDKAIADFETALKLKPDNEIYRKNLTMAQDDKTKAEGGNKKPKKTEDEMSTDALARIYVGQEHFTEGYKYLEIERDYDKAIAEFTEGFRFVPENAQAYIGRGLAFLKKGDIDRAIADYEKSVGIEPNEFKLPEPFWGPRKALAKAKRAREGGGIGSILRWIIPALIVLGLITCIARC
jgi:tetratricopeptide (TPR) repeat protein